MREVLNSEPPAAAHTKSKSKKKADAVAAVVAADAVSTAGAKSAKGRPCAHHVGGTTFANLTRWENDYHPATRIIYSEKNVKVLNINSQIGSHPGQTYTIGEMGSDKQRNDWDTDGKSSVNEGKEGLVPSDDNVNIVDTRGPGNFGVKITIDRQVD